MKFGIAVWTFVGFAAVACGTRTRDFKAPGAGGSAGDAGAPGDAGAAGEDAEAGGMAGQAGAEADAGAAGMAGAPVEADPCLACAGDTPECKDLGTSVKCVACLADTDCSNGGTCSSANACVCSARFNGKHCEFQVFRGLGTLQGDARSSASNISRDGSVVIGTSVTLDGQAYHGFRSVNGAALQFIPNPTSLPDTSPCPPGAVDSAGNVLLICNNAGELFLYSTAGIATPIAWPTSARLTSDISLDGKVIVGGVGDQAVRRVDSLNTLLGPLQPGGSSGFTATNGDGSVAVGKHYGGGYVPIRWTATTGLVALPVLSTWMNTAATDVSTDGKVIVGGASLESEILTGQVAVKWSGASLSPTALSPASVAASATAVNLDGSVIVGSQGSPSVAMLWDSAGAHTVKSLLASTPDLTYDWSLDSAVGVSDDGKFVVGSGKHGAHVEAWIAHLP